MSRIVTWNVKQLINKMSHNIASAAAYEGKVQRMINGQDTAEQETEETAANG